MVFSATFGKILAAHFRAPSVGVTNITAQDITDTARTLVIYSTVNGDRFNGSAAIGRVRIGQGTTPANPTDFTIETPFGTSPESGSVVQLQPSYIDGSGEVNQASSYSSLGSNDSVTEETQTVDFKSSALARSFMVTRDIVSPAVPFEIGKSLNIINKEVFA